MVEKQSPNNPSGAIGASASIVRYPNRRFYDRSQGKYVTLPEIAAMIREGKNVTVLDSKTNDDLTSTILTQIILAHHPERMDLLPVPLLHVMIRTNDVILGLLREYFRQSLVYVDFWQKASAFTPMTASMEWPKAILPATPAAPADAAVPGVKGVPVASGPPSPAAQKDSRQAELLIKRLAELERRLNALDSVAGEREATAAEQQPKMTEPSARRRLGRDRGQPREKN